MPPSVGTVTMFALVYGVDAEGILPLMAASGKQPFTVGAAMTTLPA